MAVRDTQNPFGRVLPAAESGGGGGFPNATYLTENDETADLPNSRALLAGTNVSFDDSTPGERTINVTGGGGGGGLVLLATYNASGAPSVDITSVITSTYDNYLIKIDNLVTSASTIIRIKVSTNNGSSWDGSANYDTGGNYGFPGSEGPMGGLVGGTAWRFRDVNTTLQSDGSYVADLNLYNPLSGKRKKLVGTITSDDSGVGCLFLSWFGRWNLTTPVDAIQFIPDSGTLTGNIYVYGYEK